jgi:hypothetical protein
LSKQNGDIFLQREKKPRPVEVTLLPIPEIKIGGGVEIFANLYIIGGC